VPFALPEYDSAFTLFVSDLVRDMARSRDPVLGAMSFEPAVTTAATRIQDRQGVDVDLPSVLTGWAFSYQPDDVRGGNLDAFAVVVDQAADDLAEQLVKQWVATMDTVTTATGNVVDAGGKLTFEKLLEMLEQIEWTLDDDDNLVMPSLVMHPDTVKLLPKETEETKAKMDELFTRKREEALARRRRRRLS
jgi:hypothetical protein